MVTAFRISRPLRLFRLAVLLFALLSTHGVHSHGLAAHESPLTAVTATAATSVDFTDHDTAPGHHSGDEAEHRAESCASGQPPYRADLPVRGTTPLGFAELTRLHAPAFTLPANAVPASVTWRDPAILRV
ncbi:hypothetical protein ACIBLA_03100 [Streptomyces sp. NPDC050433]|uniref:hypothetical protein n=1 Tax=unclassified Streptomyces TaxID=2593676 RepID=UPI0034419044